MDILFKDILAALILVGCFILLALGIDSYVSSTITLIIGYYFGRRTDAEVSKGNNLAISLKR
jgi:hypothetical protein